MNGDFELNPEALWFLRAAVFAVGACIGSFLNVCAWRLPRGESVVSPPSKCPRCGHYLAWYENIPFLSWSVQGGKCRSCRTPVSPRYFIGELVVGLLFLTVWEHAVAVGDPLPFLAPRLAMVMLAFTTTVIDLEHGIIPNKTTYPVAIFGLIFAAAVPEYWHSENPLSAVGLAVAAAAAVFAALGGFAMLGAWLFKKEALGWGDVKYVSAAALCLGPRAAFFIILFGSLMGSLFGLALIVRHGGGGKTIIRFGPFLAAATILWLLLGETMISWYYNFAVAAA